MPHALRFLIPILTLAQLASAQVVPTGFVVDTVLAAGLQFPNDCCFLADGRVLVANSPGSVSIYAGGSAVTIGTVPNVESGGERGLLSIAADPAFASNGFLYVYYSSTLDSFMHLDRFTCVGDRSSPTSVNLTFAASSRRVVLGTLPDNASNHNGGSSRFGPDDMPTSPSATTRLRAARRTSLPRWDVCCVLPSAACQPGAASSCRRSRRWIRARIR